MRPAVRLHHPVDKYRDAVAKACTNASALGAAKGDRVSLGVEAENASSDITATDDKDVNAEVDLTVVALTLDADGRVTSAIGDMAEPALTIAADGGVTAPDTVRSKLELGDSYGMRNASTSARSGTSTARAIAATSRARRRKRRRTSPPTARTPTLRPSAPSPSTLCKRPQGMRLRMRHYKLNGKSDRHREVAVFLRLRGRPVPLPLGEVSAKQTERASPSPESRRAAISRPFVRAMLSPRLYISVSVLALSVSPPLASSPRGGALGRPVNFLLDA